MSVAGSGAEPSGLERSTVDGRVPGIRGQATRERLLDATVESLDSTPWRSVKVIDVARLAGTSPATFYQYFENLEQAIGFVAERMMDEAEGVAALIDGDWSNRASWQTALDVVEGFLAYWERNKAVFRVLDLATAEGDAHLRGVRVRALNAVTVALAAAINRNASGAGHTSRSVAHSPAGTDSMAVAGALVAMAASVSAHRYGFEFWGIRTRDLVDSQARFLHWAVTGRPVPALVSRQRANARPRG